MQITFKTPDGSFQMSGSASSVLPREGEKVDIEGTVYFVASVTHRVGRFEQARGGNRFVISSTIIVLPVSTAAKKEPTS